MRNGVENRFFQMMSKLNNLFVMAGWAGKRPQGDSGTSNRDS